MMSSWNRRVVLAAALLLLSACDPLQLLEPRFDVEIGFESLALAVGDTVSVYPNIRGFSGGSVYTRWQSSNPEVANVTGDRLIALKPGTTEVMVIVWTLDDGATDQMLVRVSPRRE
jgi:hypothetical protein